VISYRPSAASNVVRLDQNRAISMSISAPVNRRKPVSPVTM
jgi:hypothetical protein